MKTTLSEDVVQIKHQDKNHENILLVNWIMSNCCNYCCSYCPTQLNGGSHPWAAYEQVVSFFGKLSAHYVKGFKKKLFFCFNGGEISIHPEITKICKFLKMNDCGIALLSNGSADLSFWSGIVPFIDHICLSYHSESASKDEFVKKVEFLHEKVTTHVNLMVHPDHFDTTIALGKLLLTNFSNFSLSFPPLMKQLGVSEEIMGYSGEQLQTIQSMESLAQEINWTVKPVTYRGLMNRIYKDGLFDSLAPGEMYLLNQTSFTGWKCWAGLEMLSIFYDGSIYPAWCFEGTKKERIGTVFDSSLEFPDKPFICPNERCWDYSDIMMTKMRN